MNALVLIRWIRLLLISWRSRASWLLQNASILWIESVLLNPKMRRSQLTLSEDSEELNTFLTRSRSRSFENQNEPSSGSYAKKSTSKPPYPPRNAPEREIRSSRRTNKRKQNNPAYMKQHRNAIREIRKLQNTTGFLIPRAPFARLVRQFINKYSIEVGMITRTALEALQEATEMYITQILNDAYLLTLHRGRVTLSKKDIDILLIVRLVK